MLLQARIEDVSIVTASSLAEALQITKTPDVVVLDVRLPGISGLTGMPLLRRNWPRAQVVILSSQSDEETRKQALEAGATTFISKAESGDRIVEILCGLMKGETPRRLGISREQGYLTPRQCEVLDLICHGMTNKMIAKKLQLSENTVRRHIQDIFTFFRVVSRTEAVYEARRRGMVA